MASRNGRTPDDNRDVLDEDIDSEDEEYDAMMLLDRLESLEEEMEDLEITSLDQLRGRIRDLHAELGE